VNNERLWLAEAEVERLRRRLEIKEERIAELEDRLLEISDLYDQLKVDFGRTR